MPVEVRIPLAEIERWDNQVLTGHRTVERLREAGIPVVGALFPKTVERGALTVFDDPMFGERVYRWSEEVPA